MDNELFFIFVFVLILVILVGGSILAFPLTRRLGDLLEQRLQDRRVGAIGESVDDVRTLRARLTQLESELGRIVERQEFVEKVLEERSERAVLPRAD